MFFVEFTEAIEVAWDGILGVCLLQFLKDNAALLHELCGHERSRV